MNQISFITSERVSREIPGDLLTKWDEDSYHVVEYVGGKVEKTLILSKRPSIMLKHVEKVFNDWDLQLNMDAMGWSLGNSLIKDRLIFHDTLTSIYLNPIHRDMISDDAFGNWYLYKDGMLDISGKSVKLEDWIAEIILKEAKKYPNDIQLQRCIKLKSLLK